jgi:hypothetical protein
MMLASFPQLGQCASNAAHGGIMATADTHVSEGLEELSTSLPGRRAYPGHAFGRIRAQLLLCRNLPGTTAQHDHPCARRGVFLLDSPADHTNFVGFGGARKQCGGPGKKTLAGRHRGLTREKDHAGRIDPRISSQVHGNRTTSHFSSR